MSEIVQKDDLASSELKNLIDGLLDKVANEVGEMDRKKEPVVVWLSSDSEDELDSDIEVVYDSGCVGKGVNRNGMNLDEKKDKKKTASGEAEKSTENGDDADELCGPAAKKEKSE